MCSFPSLIESLPIMFQMLPIFINIIAKRKKSEKLPEFSTKHIPTKTITYDVRKETSNIHEDSSPQLS